MNPSTHTIPSKKDVIIVGTGVAGSLIAKLLTDHVFDTKTGKMIHRTEAGEADKLRELSILLLEAGLEAGVQLDATTSMNTYNEYMRTFYEQKDKVPNSPYPNLKQAPSPNILDVQHITPPLPSKEGYLVQMGPSPFASDAIRIGGGTTLHWLGTTPRMLPNDFRVKEKYGLAVDWPLDYETLKPYYEMAEFEMGVSGDVSKQQYPNVADIENYYGKGYVFPMEEIPQTYMDKKIIEKLAGTEVTLNGEKHRLLFCSSPQARNSTPNKMYPNSVGIKATSVETGYKMMWGKSEKSHYKPVGSVWDPHVGERCEGNASCVPICPVQAKYNALKSLKKALYKVDENNLLQKNPSVQVQAQSVVYKIGVAPDGSHERKITKLHLRRYISKDKSDFVEEIIDTSDSIVILAANAIENPKILLNSTYSVQEDGQQVEKIVANHSDQVGRNLMDHVFLMTWGLFPEPVYPFRGPSVTSNISSFRDGAFRSEFSAFISPLDNWGWWWTSSPSSDVQEFLNKGYFGTELKESLTNRLSRQTMLHFEIEQLPNPNNRITISNEYLDVLGIPRPVIHYQLTEYEMEATKQAKLVSDEIFNKLGIENFTEYRPTDKNTFIYDGIRYSLGGAGHIVGTHRMGFSPDDSVTDSHCKAWDHPNLYLVGAGSMPTVGTSNPTLTVAALAIRSVESILNHLEHIFKKEQ